MLRVSSPLAVTPSLALSGRKGLLGVAVGAEHLEVLWGVVEGIVVNVIHLQARTPCMVVVPVPSALRAPIGTLYKVAANTTRNITVPRMVQFPRLPLVNGFLPFGRSTTFIRAELTGALVYLVFKLYTTVLTVGSLPGSSLALRCLLVVIGGGARAGTELGFVVFATAV